MNRRGFLQAILAAGVAPWAITKAGVLMPVRKVIVPEISWEPRQFGFVGPRSGKSWFIVQEAVRRANASPNDKIAILSYYKEPTRSFIETLVGPTGMPINLTHLPQPGGKT